MAMLEVVALCATPGSQLHSTEGDMPYLRVGAILVIDEACLVAGQVRHARIILLILVRRTRQHHSG